MTLKQIVRTLAPIAVLGIVTVSAHAQGTHTSVHSRISNQEMRIREGVANGSLTPAEARRLRERDIMIRYESGWAHISGGHMTSAERARLEKKLNRNSKAIHNQKHDAQHRPHHW